MPRFRVQLDGFRFQAKDPITQAVNLAEVDELDADGPEMAQIEFMKRWGINSTTRPFHIRRVLAQGEPAAVAAERAPEPDARAELDALVADAAESGGDTEAEPEPAAEAVTLGPEITLQPAPVLSSPAPVPVEQPAAPAGKRAKASKRSLVGDPDGVMDEIRKL